jgi:aminoglycoside phosphotransferase (APT) family kinase protein
VSPSTLEAVAERWVPGTGAVVVRRPASGLVNVSCRVDRDDRAYSLRVASPDADDLGLGLDREWECRVLRRAAAAGLAPRLRHCLPQHGIVVADWVDGRPWSAAEIGTPAAVGVMAELLRRVHALRIPGPARVMNAGSWIAHYSAAAARLGCRGAPQAPGLGGMAAQRLHELGALGPPPPVLCHSDVHRLNIVSGGAGGRASLLDWEYAHVSDGLWDLAGWAANNDWTRDAALRLLAAYLQRPPMPAEMRRLELLTWLYDYVCLLWSDIYAQRRAGEDTAAVAARAALLAARLAEDPGSRAG